MRKADIVWLGFMIALVGILMTLALSCTFRMRSIVDNRGYRYLDKAVRDDPSDVSRGVDSYSQKFYYMQYPGAYMTAWQAAYAAVGQGVASMSKSDGIERYNFVVCGETFTPTLADPMEMVIVDDATVAYTIIEDWFDGFKTGADANFKSADASDGVTRFPSALEDCKFKLVYFEGFDDYRLCIWLGYTDNGHKVYDWYECLPDAPFVSYDKRAGWFD